MPRNAASCSLRWNSAAARRWITVEPAVRRIVARCAPAAAIARCCGMRRKFDGLTKRRSCGLRAEEMQRAWEATAPELQAALTAARATFAQFAKRQLPKEWTQACSRRERRGRSCGRWASWVAMCRADGIRCLRRC